VTPSVTVPGDTNLIGTPLQKYETKKFSTGQYSQNHKPVIVLIMPVEAQVLTIKESGEQPFCEAWKIRKK